MKNNIKVLLLAAGLGSRLKPLTDKWPKCLMPIGEYPLLEYWLYYLENLHIGEIFVNLHHHHEIVQNFLNRPKYKNRVHRIYENELKGTAGTILSNLNLFENSTLLLIHADNWTNSGLSQFIDFHLTARPKNCLMSMMTFKTSNPESCGIIETNKKGVVTAFHEKKKGVRGNIANAAIYLIEPQVINWLKNNPSITDFSTQVIPKFLGKIATWENNSSFIDIGTIEKLQLAQKENFRIDFGEDDKWIIDFKETILKNINI